MAHRFFTLDVFTKSPLAGNPLAVVTDARGLGDGAMQAIAREFNLSETVFIWPPDDPHHRARVRIFTPASELPFAGHPTIGTAVLIGLLDHGPKHGTLAFGLEEGVGVVPCAVEIHGEGAGSAAFTLPKMPEHVSDLGAREDVAAALGLSVADIGFGGHRAARYSAGLPTALVPVASRAAVVRIAPQVGLWRRAFGAPPNLAYVYCPEPIEARHAFYARALAPDMGIAEDPATGSAVAALAGAIIDFDRPADGEHRFTIEQGYAMGRPSQIGLTLLMEGGRLARATISGEAVVVSEGSLFL